MSSNGRLDKELLNTVMRIPSLQLQPTTWMYLSHKFKIEQKKSDTKIVSNLIPLI